MPILRKTTSPANILAGLLSLFFAGAAPASTAGNEFTDFTFTLTCPDGDGPFSTMVILPDQSDGRTTRQLAQALAENEIAAAVYTGRAETGPTTREALQVVAALKDNKKIGQKSIFVLGHGQNAALIPLIAAANQNICGFVLLAGAAAPEKNSNYNAAEAIKRVTRPLMIVQGAKDKIVSADNFQIWWEALDGRTNATFKVYSDLDHSFSKANENTFSAEAINDLSKWLKAQGEPTP